MWLVGHEVKLKTSLSPPVGSPKIVSTSINLLRFTYISDLVQAGSSLLESEDLFNSTYVPNNPSLVLDTALWKSSEVHHGGAGGTENSSPLVHLQPILLESNSNNEENNV